MNEASIIGAIGKHGEAFDSNFETVRRCSSRSTTRSHHYRITRCFAAQFRNRAIPSRWILSRYYARMSHVLCPCSMRWYFVHVRQIAEFLFLIHRSIVVFDVRRSLVIDDISKKIILTKKNKIVRDRVSIYIRVWSLKS